MESAIDLAFLLRPDGRDVDLIERQLLNEPEIELGEAIRRYAPLNLAAPGYIPATYVLQILDRLGLPPHITVSQAIEVARKRAIQARRA